MGAAPKDMADDVDVLRSQAAELQEQIKRLELRKAIPEGTVELPGKGQGVDPGMLTNREKTPIANSLRPARRLNEILAELGMCVLQLLFLGFHNLIVSGFTPFGQGAGQTLLAFRPAHH